MKIAAWNLNHRAGSRFTPFYPEAATAIGSLPVDVIVLTEYFPKNKREEFVPELHKAFVADLGNCGFSHSMISAGTGARANRVLIAAKRAFDPDPLPMPVFDQQFPANVLAVRFPSIGIRLIGIRIPYYTAKKQQQEIDDSWAWLEGTAKSLMGDQAVIVGDLNVGLKSHAPRGGDHFRRILSSGWIRGQPTSGSSFYGTKDVNTEIDHALCSPSLQFRSAQYQSKTANAAFAGTDDALSDHAVLMVEVDDISC